MPPPPTLVSGRISPTRHNTAGSTWVAMAEVASSDVTVQAADDVSTASQQQPVNGTAAVAARSAAHSPHAPSKLSVDVEESTGAVLDAEALASLHRWLACICVVTFDLEMGPTMEYCYPPAYLSQAEIASGQSANHSLTHTHRSAAPAPSS